jgi:hypothetical protein
MPAINGTVEFLSIKERAKPDNYENTHRASIKIGDSWYSYGTIKKDKVNIKTGDSWTELQKGMEVEFMYDQNGDFANIKKKTFSITDASTAVASAPVQQSSVQGQGTQAGNKTSFVNPAEIGQCLNLAVDVLGLNGEELLDDAEVKKAIAWYKAVRIKFNTLYNDVEDTKPEPKTKKPTPVVEDGYDDEV